MTWAIDTATERRRLISCALEVPSEGAWWIDAVCDGDRPISGSVTCTLGTATWLGTAWASQVDGQRVRVRIVGGAGGLESAVSDRQESGKHVTVATVASAIASIGGETVSAAPLTQLGTWMRMRGTVASALDHLCRVTGLRWRVSSRGAIDVYAQAPAAPEAPGVAREHRADATVYGVDDFAAEPPFLGVEHITFILTEKGDASAIFRAVSPRSVLLGLDDARPHDRAWAGRVTSQDGGFVNVSIDAETSAGVGPAGLPAAASKGAWALSRVPLWTGIPGTTLELRPGAGVVVFFREGDPRKPAAMLSPYGEKADAVTIETEGGARIRITGDVVELGGSAYAMVRYEALFAWLTAILNGICINGSPLSVVPPIPFPTLDHIKADGPGRVG